MEWTRPSQSGALPSQRLKELITEGAIQGASQAHVRPASLDLTISREVYRIEHVFLPRTSESVRAMLPALGAEQHHLMTPMECGVTYLARLNERFAFPDEVYGLCNPKSTTGRNDIHVRVIADGTSRYDDLSPAGFHGEAWLVIRPRSYPVRIPADTPLAQARLFTADTRMDGSRMVEQFMHDPLLFDDTGASYSIETLPRHEKGELTLTVDLSTPIVGYECLAPRSVLDLSEHNADLSKYFRPMMRGTREDNAVVLKEGGFYILSSYERVRVPPTLACEMHPMDERYGDFRTHYAGFIDPGWGWGEAGEGLGRPLTLEVRPFENLVLRHRQPIALIGFEEMAAYPDTIYDALNSHYIDQQKGPRLAKQFTG